MAINASPYNPNDPKDNENNNVSGTAPAGSVGAVGQDNAPQGVGAPTSGGAAPGAATPAGSGQFVNLQKYLGANQGAGNVMAGQIEQKGQNQSEAVGNTIGQANTVIGGQIDAEKNRIAQASGFANQISQDPTKLVNDPNQLSAYKQLQAGTTNSGQLNDQTTQQLGAAQGQLNDLQNFSNQAGSEAGRFDLLRQSLGRPTYSQGQQRLDQLLIQNDPNHSLNSLQQNLGGQVNQQKNLFNTTQQGLNTGIASLDPAALAAQQQLAGAVGTFSGPGGVAGTGALGSLQSKLTDQLAARQGLADTNYQGFQDRLKSNKLTSEDVDKYLAPMFGSDLNADTGLFGATPEKLANAYTESTYNLNNTADMGDYNRLQALKTLSGQTGPTPIELDQSQIGNVGGPDININANKINGPGGFDLNGLNSKYQADMNNYQLLQGQSTAGYLAETGVRDRLSASLNANQNNPEGRYKAYMDAANDPGLANNEPAKQALMNAANQYIAQQPGGDMVSSGNQYAMPVAGTVAVPEGNLMDAEANALAQQQYDAGANVRAANVGADAITNSQLYQNYMNRQTPLTGILKALPGEAKTNGSITSLMSPEEAAKWTAAHPTSYDKTMKAGVGGLMSAADYDTMYNKYVSPTATVGSAGGKTLLDLAPGMAAQGYGNYLSAFLGGPYSSAGRWVENVGQNLFSDENLKTNIKDGSADTYKFLDSLSSNKYEYKNKDHGSGTYVSPMAQDLEKTTAGKGAVTDTPEGKQVNYSRLLGTILSSQADIHKRLKHIEGKKKK